MKVVCLLKSVYVVNSHSGATMATALQVYCMYIHVFNSFSKGRRVKYDINTILPLLDPTTNPPT